MRIISRKPLREFWEAHPDAEAALSRWWRVVEEADWTNFSQLHATFPAADIVGRLTIFDVGGNQYRVAARVEYGKRRVYVRRVMTHKEYDKGNWKSDPWA
jgi:mRNA interferase HigB